MASLRAQLDKAVGSAFAAVGDIPHVCTYTSLNAGSTGMDNYDITTGSAATNGTPYTLNSVLFTKFSELDTDVLVQTSTDQKMTFQLSALPVTPKNKDQVLDDVGRNWEVIRFLSDPASVLAILHVRTT